MSSAIRYINELGKEITFQQINSTDGYFKIFYDNDHPTKKEYYVNGLLKNTSYIMQSQSEIDSFLIDNPNTSIEYLYDESSYKIVEDIVYIGGIILEKRATVFDSAGSLICSKLYRLINNALTVINTEKYYYDGNNEDKYYFIYNDDGTCFQVCDLQIDDADFYVWSIGVDPNITFTWSGLEYYQNAEPLVPNQPK